jgi:hypothetical protein
MKKYIYSLLILSICTILIGCAERKEIVKTEAGMLQYLQQEYTTGQVVSIPDTPWAFLIQQENGDILFIRLGIGIKPKEGNKNYEQEYFTTTSKYIILKNQRNHE